MILVCFLELKNSREIIIPEIAVSDLSFSRLYGGIHYRFDSEKGLEGGRILGRYILDNIHLTR